MNIDFSKVVTKSMQEELTESYLLRKIAERRYIAETHPVTINGICIYTDRDTRALLSHASMLMSDSETIHWKTVSGNFVELDKGKILFISQSLFRYVQDCFKREQELGQKVADGTFSHALLDEGWPDVTIQVNP